MTGGRALCKNESAANSFLLLARRKTNKKKPQKTCDYLRTLRHDPKKKRRPGTLDEGEPDRSRTAAS